MGPLLPLRYIYLSAYRIALLCLTIPLEVSGLITLPIVRPLLGKVYRMGDLVTRSSLRLAMGYLCTTLITRPLTRPRKWMFLRNLRLGVT